MSALLISRIVLILMDESTASNSQSLLLKLPQEIQDQIYELVCGGNLLHFEFDAFVRDSKSEFCHIKCLSKITVDDAQASFDASTSPWVDVVSANLHMECCSPRLFGHESGRTCGMPTLDLRFLRTCRQIYDAAKNLCYSTNIISFDSLDIFKRFVKTVSWVPRIRSLRLCIYSGNSSGGAALSKTLKHLVSKVTGLERIHIDLLQILGHVSRTYDKGAEEDSVLTKQLLCLAGTALRAATVVISDTRSCDLEDSETTQGFRDDDQSQRGRRWTMKQKQEYAHFLRNALLGHRGKGNEGDIGDSTESRV